MGSIELNASFPRSVGHHIDNEHIINIPAKIHRRIWHNVWSGQGMEEINEIAESWLIYEILLENKTLEEQKRVIDRFIE